MGALIVYLPSPWETPDGYSGAGYADRLLTLMKRLAARRLATMRGLAGGSGSATEVDALFTNLLSTHGRRPPRLHQEVDRASLP